MVKITSNPFKPGVLYDDRAFLAFAGINRRTAIRLRASGELRYLKIGRSVRYFGEDLLAFLENARQGGAA